MNKQIKERITDYVTFLEAAGKEHVSIANKMKEILLEIKQSDSEEVKKDKATEYFAILQYSSLLARDIGGKIYALADLYLLSQTGSDKLEFTKEEIKILDGYTEQAVYLFVLENGKIETITKDLLSMMYGRAKTIADSSTIEGIIKQSENINNNE